MISNDPKEGTAPDQWALINRTLQIYKGAAAGLTLAATLMAGLAIYCATANPVVVVRECGEKSFYEGKREKIKITDDDVKHFIEEWVKLRYTWTDSDPEKITRAVAPLSSEGLQGKLRDLLGKQSAQAAKMQGTQGLADKKIEESIANIHVTLTDKEATASFDRIIRINAIPIVVPSEVALQIVQGAATKWNRLGLYVNGVVEREEK